MYQMLEETHLNESTKHIVLLEYENPAAQGILGARKMMEEEDSDLYVLLEHDNPRRWATWLCQALGGEVLVLSLYSHILCPHSTSPIISLCVPLFRYPTGISAKVIDYTQWKIKLQHTI